MRLLFRGSLSVAVLSTLCGCVSPMDETTNAVLNAEKIRDRPAESPSSSEKPAERIAEKPAERKAERSTVAESARRDERPATTATRESRPAASADAGRAELVSQLNEVTRELAALRVANAKLKAGASSSAGGSSGDEKLDATLRSYTQFKRELAAVVAETEKLRAENAALTVQVKELKAKSNQNSAAVVARLEKELQAERAARAEAERTATALRDQLRAVARAVNAAAVPPEGGNTRR